RPVDGLPAKPERVVFSPSGNAAAVYSAGVLTVITGMPDAPAVGATVNLDDASGALAISDDGRYFLAAGSGSVRLLTGAGVVRKLMDAADGTRVAFAPDGHLAAIAESGGAALVFYGDVTADSEPNVDSTQDDEMASPAGLV